LVYCADQGTTGAKGASKRHGIELNNRLVLDRWLLVDADMAWTHARYADANANANANANASAGNLIGNAVGRVALLGVTAHELGPWSAGLITRFIGSYPLSQDGHLTAKSSLVSNLQVKCDLTPRISLQVDVLNLFDRKFYEIEYQQDYKSSRSALLQPSGVTVHPGEPRAIRVGINVRL
jgi:outer membrane receptor protein involved in Fe transport